MTGFYLPISCDRGYCYSTEKGVSYRSHHGFLFPIIPVTPFIFDITKIRVVDDDLIFNCQLTDIESGLTLSLVNVRIKNVLSEIRRTGRINNPDHFKNAVTAVLNRLISDEIKRKKEGSDGS